MAIGNLMGKDEIVFMLGNQDVLDQISSNPIFDENRIKPVKRDMAVIDELLAEIEKNRKIKYCILCDMAFTGFEDGEIKAVEAIRSINEEIKIAVVLTEKKISDKFRRILFGYGVYEVFETVGTLPLNDIVDKLIHRELPVFDRDFEGKAELEDNLKRKSDEVFNLKNELEGTQSQVKALEEELERRKAAAAQSPEENKEEQEAIRLMNEQISALKQKLLDEQSEKEELESGIEDLKSEYQKRMEETIKAYEEREREIEEKTKQQIEDIRREAASKKGPETIVKKIGTTTIGISGLSHGAGATYTAVNIANSLSDLGYSVALVALDGKEDLEWADIHKNVEVFTRKTGSIQVFEIMNCGYDYIVEDFGVVFQLDPEGEPLVGSRDEYGNLLSESQKSELVSEFYRCTFKVIIGASAPWHIGKLNFISPDQFDEYTTIVCVEGISRVKEAKRLDFPVYERDEELINSLLHQKIGLELTELKPKKKGLFF